MAYEPMILLVSVGLYYVNHSFYIKNIVSGPAPAIVMLPGIFLGLLYVFTIKLRKSPFDLSMSHHGHQEIVKGITTEYSGTDLAVIEVKHWIEVIISLSFVYVFFAYAAPWSHALAVAACAVVYFLEILIDNCFARAKWQYTLKSSWAVTAVLGAANFIVLSILK
jgi:ech hydrogenase subunit B